MQQVKRGVPLETAAVWEPGKQFQEGPLAAPELRGPGRFILTWAGARASEAPNSWSLDGGCLQPRRDGGVSQSGWNTHPGPEGSGWPATCPWSCCSLLRKQVDEDRHLVCLFFTCIHSAYPVLGM